MEPLDALEQLAGRARRERAPVTNVDVALLLSQARRAQAGALPLFPLAWSAAAAAVAAAIVVVLAIGSGTLGSGSTTASTDSVSQLFAPAQVDMP